MTDVPVSPALSVIDDGPAERVKLATLEIATLMVAVEFVMSLFVPPFPLIVTM
jgi:hypothetical protein